MKLKIKLIQITHQFDLFFSTNDFFGSQNFQEFFKDSFLFR